jgi:hypothetical protein
MERFQMNKEIKKEDLFTAIKYGHLWQDKDIKDELENHIEKDLDIRFDPEDNHYYIYANECYLIIRNKSIEISCYRPKAPSYDKHVDFDIKDISDVITAYDAFISMINEQDL